MKNIDDVIENVIKEIAETKAALNKKITELVKPVIKSLFESIPELKAMQWVQFTPWFNDGDECIFSIHDASFFIDPKILDIYREVDEDEPAVDFDDLCTNALRSFGDYEYNAFSPPWFYRYKDSDPYEFKKYYNKYTKEALQYEKIVEVIGEDRINKINELLRTYNSNVHVLEDGYRAAFGNHSMVTVVRGENDISISVDDYDHD